MTVGVLFLFPAPAPARSVRAIGEIEATVGGIEEDVARIEARYLTLREGYQSSLRKREKDLLYKRFLEGKTLLLEEKDYEAAREFFYSLVEEEPFFQQFAEYREALFYLAESLFLTHRFDEAERYYLRVSQEGPASPFYLQVLRRLMEIALVRSDWKTFDARYQEFLASGPTPAQIADYGYLVGKRYFFEGKIERAWRFFESVPKDAPDYGYARYFQAVILTQEGQYAEAIKTFKEARSVLDQRGEKDRKNASLLEKITINIARLYYELKDYENAISTYRRIEEQSPFYSTTLFELMNVYYDQAKTLLKQLQLERIKRQEIEETYQSLLARAGEDARPDPKDQEAYEQEMKRLEERHHGLENQIDTITRTIVSLYEKLKSVDPTNKTIPNAELLIANLYVSEREFEKSESWFNEISTRYQEYKKQLERLRTSSQEAEGAASPSPLPPELLAWIEDKGETAMTKKIMARISRQRKALKDLETMLAQLRESLEKWEQQEYFPVIDTTARRTLGLEADTEDVFRRISIVEDLVNEMALPPDQKDALLARLDTAERKLQGIVTKARAFYEELQETKAQWVTTIAERIEAQELPLQQLAQAIDRYEEMIENQSEHLTPEAIDRLAKEIDRLVVNASLGMINIALYKTRERSERIRAIQEEQVKELEMLNRRLESGDLTPEASAEEEMKESTQDASPGVEDDSSAQEAPATPPDRPAGGAQ